MEGRPEPESNRFARTILFNYLDMLSNKLTSSPLKSDRFSRKINSIKSIDRYTFKVYIQYMSRKNVPHHMLSDIQAKFADVESLEITTTAIRSANAIGCALEDIVDVVQALEKRDFVKSETQHNPPNPKVWHDTYKAPMDGMRLYLKFAGETLVDVTLVSFKEV